MNKNEKNKPTAFFSASQLDSFAYFTIKERFPKIYNDYCSGNYEDFVEYTTVEDALKNILEDKDCPDLSFIQGKETKTLKDFFENEPFFEAEVLFYHVLLAQKEYFKNKNDFFAIKKDTDYANEHDSYRNELKNLFNQKGYYNNIKNKKKILVLGKHISSIYGSLTPKGGRKKKNIGTSQNQTLLKGDKFL